MNYLFDIDGTLTPARQKIDSKFAEFFLKWIQTHSTYLVSGSDYPKLMEQIDLAILEKVKMVFSSSGNVGHKQGNEIYRNEWVYPKQLLDHLEKILQVHPYPVRTGNHIELRPGMINFSIIGRKCTSEQRREYYLYDQESQERAAICRDIMDNHPNIHASIGGQISVDIYKEGANKPQIIKHIQGQIGRAHV